MTLVKITIKSGGHTYVSVDLNGHGSDNTNFHVALTSAQILKENFPAFNGTAVEWELLMSNTTEIKKEILGN